MELTKQIVEFSIGQIITVHDNCPFFSKFFPQPHSLFESTLDDIPKKKGGEK